MVLDHEGVLGRLLERLLWIGRVGDNMIFVIPISGGWGRSGQGVIRVYVTWLFVISIRFIRSCHQGTNLVL